LGVAHALVRAVLALVPTPGVNAAHLGACPTMWLISGVILLMRIALALLCASSSLATIALRCGQGRPRLYKNAWAQ